MGFSFEHNPNAEITLEFVDNGLTFTVFDGAELDAGVRQVAEYEQAYREDARDNPNDEQAFYSYIARCIDAVLGEGAYAAIFEDRPKNPMEHLDVLNYVVSTIKEARDKRMAGYKKMAAAGAGEQTVEGALPNRDARRANGYVNHKPRMHVAKTSE